MAETATKTRELVTTRIKEPSKYKVIFMNDDYTPVEFVIALLMSIFKHDQASATKITLQIHNDGSGVAGIYTYEVAEQKQMEATVVSRNNNYPLAIKLEEE
jgi:ATP-dependent Clp protease adaptor protein ClpS